MEKSGMSRWSGRKVLAIGDSITADGRWQEEFARITGCEMRTHAYGGIGLIEMVRGLGGGDPEYDYDPHTGTEGALGPLTAEDLRDIHLIILAGPYNERHLEYGERGDMWPENDTLRGKFAYVIGRIYSLLWETGNSACRIMLVTPHCVGRYDWVDVDGYGDFPAGSGRSLETMSEEIERIAGEYNLPCFNAWKRSGIGRFTWRFYAHSPVEMNKDYDPRKNYEAPYPMYADQVHLNAAGYKRLGESIAAAAETI